MKMVSLGSGSSGNCTWVSGERGAVLIDAGLSSKAIIDRLKSQQIDPAGIKGVFLTHEHQDHWRGVPKICKDLKVPLFTGQGTFDFLRDKMGKDINFTAVKESDVFHLGGLTVQGHGLIHDAAEPYCYSVSEGQTRVAVVTDLGQISSNLIEVVKRVDALIFEANYDKEMLAQSKYPASLKKRISSGRGHLANDIAASFLAEYLDEKCQLLLLAHLSENANTPYRALMTYRHYLMPLLKKNLNMGIAPRHQASGVMQIKPLDLIPSLTLPLKNSA